MTHDPLLPVTSFEEVYRENFAFVWRSLARLGLREADLPDAAQEVFLVAHRKLAEFEGRAKLSTWLFRICLRVASDQRARAHVRREVLDASAGRETLDPADDAETTRARDEDLELLDAALAAMSLEHRTVFVLFELEGMSTVEIAQAVEAPLGTVYSRLRRARELFQRAVQRRSRAELPTFARGGT